MFERFTERARQVVVLAQEETRILKHNYIGTEHILLGLLREEEGMAARALKALDITVGRVRAQVVRIVGSGEQATSGQLPFMPEAKKVLELALHEALALGDDYIGTEHILLGLIREEEEEEGVASKILRGFGLESPTIRDEVIRVIAVSGDEPPYGDLRTARIPEALLDWTGEALRVLAVEVAESLGRPADGGDLLVVLASVHGGIAARTLATLGIDAERLAAAARKSRGEDLGSGFAPDPALLTEVEQVRADKEAAIEAQDFERAANLHDREHQLRRQAREVVQRRLHDELLAEVRNRLRLQEK